MMDIELPEDYELCILGPYEDERTISKIIDLFRNGEPVCDYIGMSTSDLEEILSEALKDWIKEFSVAIKLKSSSEIVGIFIAKTFQKGNQLIWGAMEPTGEKAKFYVKIARMMEDGIDLYEKYDVSYCLELALLAVHEHHRGKGLGSIMVKALEEMGRRRGVELFAVTATNIATYKIFSKFGYKKELEIFYDTIDYNGRPLFDSTLSNGTQSISVMSKLRQYSSLTDAIKRL